MNGNQASKIDSLKCLIEFIESQDFSPNEVPSIVCLCGNVFDFSVKSFYFNEYRDGFERDLEEFFRVHVTHGKSLLYVKGEAVELPIQTEVECKPVSPKIEKSPLPPEKKIKKNGLSDEITKRFNLNDGEMGSNEPQRIEPTIETMIPEEPLLKSTPEPDRGKDAIPDPDIFDGDPFEDETWIKLYRKLRKNPIYKDSIAVHLFVHLLLTANHKPNRFIFNGKEIMVKRGQLVTGRKQISGETGISEWAVRMRLQLFEKLGMLTRKTTSKFSIITICNYKHYQESNYKNSPGKPPAGDGCLTTSNPPATHQQPTTNKNVRNKTSYVEGSHELRLATLLLEETRKNKPDYKEPNLQAWAKTIDLMLRIDKRSAEAVERVIRWAQADHGDGTGRWKGWAANILSPGKLRDKFDELEMKMQDKPRPKDRGAKYIDGNIRQG